jgi:hypothetical protein
MTDGAGYEEKKEDNYIFLIVNLPLLCAIICMVGTNTYGDLQWI